MEGIISGNDIAELAFIQSVYAVGIDVCDTETSAEFFFSKESDGAVILFIRTFRMFFSPSQ